MYGHPQLHISEILGLSYWFNSLNIFRGPYPAITIKLNTSDYVTLQALLAHKIYPQSFVNLYLHLTRLCNIDINGSPPQLFKNKKQNVKKSQQ